MICIIDYGVGNVQAFLNLFKSLNIKAERCSVPEELVKFDKLILPGVGHFDHAMEKLNSSGMRTQLDEIVLENKASILGICVGMQMLARNSNEGKLKGLGWIPGEVRHFSEKLVTRHYLCHTWVGIQSIKLTQTNFFQKAWIKMHNLFLHSYFFEAENQSEVSAITEYGFEFHSAVSHNNIHGVQFHPEKSHDWGKQLLKNFAEL